MPTKSTTSQRGQPKSIMSQAGEVVREVFDTITGTEEPRRKKAARAGGRAHARKAKVAAVTKTINKKIGAVKRGRPAKRLKAMVSNVKAASSRAKISRPAKSATKKRGTGKRQQAAGRSASARSQTSSARVHH